MLMLSDKEVAGGIAQPVFVDQGNYLSEPV